MEQFDSSVFSDLVYGIGLPVDGGSQYRYRGARN